MPPDYVKIKWHGEIDLAPDLLGKIGKHLVSRLDILRFRSACKQWRSTLPYPTRFPLRVPPPPNCDPERNYTPFFITELTLYSTKWTSTHMTFEEVDPGRKFRVDCALTSQNKFDFPVISFMASTDHLYSRISCVSKPHHQLRMGQQELQENYFTDKAMVITEVYGINPSLADACDVSIVAPLFIGSMHGRLALLRLRGSPENWEWDTDFCTRRFQDICTYRGRLCPLDFEGRVFLMDYESLQMTQFGPPLHTNRTGFKYVYEAFGDVYVCDISKWKLYDVVGYKLNFRHQKWQVHSGALRHLRRFGLLRNSNFFMDWSFFMRTLGIDV